MFVFQSFLFLLFLLFPMFVFFKGVFVSQSFFWFCKVFFAKVCLKVFFFKRIVLLPMGIFSIGFVCFFFFFKISFFNVFFWGGSFFFFGTPFSSFNVSCFFFLNVFSFQDFF